MNEKAVMQKMTSAISAEMSVQELIGQVRLIQNAMQLVMKEGEHYGVVPGTKKNVLLKPGAEKLLLLFRLAPTYGVDQVYENDGHFNVTTTCTLTHAPTGSIAGAGMGMCTSKESKYAYRQGKRACPACGAEALIKSKFPPKFDPQGDNAWFCFPKNGGCGKEYASDDEDITKQNTGRVPNPDLPDTYNTVLKMSNKRALVAAVLNVTAASDIFTQDLEDLPEPVAPRREQTVVIEADEIGRMMTAFSPLGVTQEMIEAYIGYPIEKLTLQGRNSLRKIYGAMSDGSSTWEDHTGVEAKPDPAARVREKIRQRREAAEPAAAMEG